MDSSNIYKFNGVDPFDNWTIIDNELYGYYPRNSLINELSKINGPKIIDDIIYIPEGVISIKGSAFKNNKKITKIYIPDSVIKISDSAFINSNITLVVNKNSYSRKYALRKGLSYEEKDEDKS